MIQIRKKQMDKKNLAIVITSAVLAALIVAYAVLSLVLPTLTGNGSGGTEKPSISDGEAYYGDRAVVYPYLKSSNILYIAVGDEEEEDYFCLQRPESKDGYLDYFYFLYKNSDNELQPYMPDIAYEDANFSYTGLYAQEGGAAYRTDYLCAALGALYFEERITLTGNNKEAQLNRYGLGEDERRQVKIIYLDSDGKKQEHILYIGDKLISGYGYYFMLDGRDCIYASAASDTLSYALDGFESFLHSRIIASELSGDNGAAPYHTNDYRQYTSSYHSTLGLLVPGGVDVVVKADYLQPIYTDAKDEANDITGKGTGYRHSGYKDFTFTLSTLNSDEFSRVISFLVGNKIGGFESEQVVTVVTDMNEAVLYDAERRVGNYKYTITKIEAVLTDGADISAAGTTITHGSIIKVEYLYTLDGERLCSEPSHAVIDLANSPAIPQTVKDSLVAAGVGELSESEQIEFSVQYTKDNTKQREIKYIITDIRYILEQDGENGVKYVDKITENSIVVYKFKYLLDGVEVGGVEEMTLDMKTATDGHYLDVKNALLGKTAANKDIEVINYAYCQPFMDFRAYAIRSIEGYVQTELTVGFAFLPEADRNTFYGESIYKNTLGDFDASHKYAGYAMNDEACDEVLRILGGISVDSSTSSGAQGVVGSETVAVGLTHKTMVEYGLYDGYKIFFELPRGLDSYSNSEEYEWIYRLGFTLYIGETQPDGTRYVGSDLYDIVVKIDAKTFDFLDFSFPEYWARRNLVMIDVGNIDKVNVTLNMEDKYGAYILDLDHNKRFYLSNNPNDFVLEKPTDKNYTEYDFINVIVRPLGDKHSDSLLMQLAKKNAESGSQSGTVDLATVYKANPEIGAEYVGYDTFGTSSFKDLLRVLYGTYYLGIVSEEDQLLASDENKLMTMSFDVGSSSAYSYNYDFYRIDDRRVMVSLYRQLDNGTKIGEVADFYISTFAFKKIVSTFDRLLNGVEIDTNRPY